MLINNKNYKLLLFTTFSFIITTTLFQNCSPVKLGQKIDQSSSNFSEGISYAPKSVSGAQVITNGNVILREYRHKSTNRYFYTSRVNDQVLLDTTFASLFDITGNSITVKAATDAGLSPVYRLFNKSGFHLYTAEINDRNISLTDSKFQDEGIEGYAIKINSNASCPTSPSVTYPVYRLSHSGSYKYRLVTDAALKSQLLTQGYSDEGILFCATAVSSTVVTGSQDCNFNGVNVANNTPVTAYQSASVPANQSCVSEQRQCSNTVLVTGSFTYSACSVQSTVGSGGACSWTWADDFSSTAPANRPRPNTACTSANDGQKQNGVAGAADWTCSCSVTPVVAGTASCSFGSATLAHGATATGYSLATGSCTSQSVTCTNGILSNPSFNLNACPSAAPTTCAARPANAVIDANMIYTQVESSNLSGSADTYVIRLDVSASSSTVGRSTVLIATAEGRGSERTFRAVSVSPCAGDFTSSSAIILSANAINTNSFVALNEPGRGVPNLTTGTWYINIKNAGCSANARCDMFVDYHHYLGTGQN